ncbi:hypothetical protein H0H93_006184 [Arthromyces matolae]|nr:hypothetical protein H0H93_006184 [Arthromyces matolae]
MNQDPVVQFTRLPQDIIMEIFRHVEWRDLLHVRQTCKYLCKLTKSRTVWLNYYRAYLAEQSFRVGVESPLASYSSSELEAWVLKRKSVDLNWETTTHALHERRFALEDRRNNYILIPGGRWLLVCTNDNSVLCFDLDDPGMKRSVLTPPNCDACGFNSIAVDVDKTSPTLKFVMVSYYDVCVLPHEAENLDILFWVVELQGHGSTAYLKANFLHSFQATEIDTTTRSASLCGHLFARVLQTQRFQYYIEVFDWKLSTSSVHQRAVIFPSGTVSQKLDSIELLPDHRLAVITPTNLFVCDIGAITEAQPTPPTIPQDATQPQWTLSHDGLDLFTHSFTIVDAESISLVSHSREKIYRLIIPRNAKQAPRLVEHAKITDCRVVSAAGARAVVKKDGVLRKVAFSSNSKSMTKPGHEIIMSQDLHQILSNPRSFPNLIFDEDTGRIVFSTSSYGSIFVIETCSLPL